MFLLFSNLLAVPAGYLFDLNSLAKDGGYTVYSQQETQKMFRLNICSPLADSVCGADSGMSGVCALSPYSAAAQVEVFIQFKTKMPAHRGACRDLKVKGHLLFWRAPSKKKGKRPDQCLTGRS